MPTDPLTTAPPPGAKRYAPVSSRKALSTPRGTAALQQALRRVAAARAATGAANASAKKTDEARGAGLVRPRTLHGVRLAASSRARHLARRWARQLGPYCNRWTAAAVGMAMAAVLILCVEGSRAPGHPTAPVEGNWAPRTARDWWTHARQHASEGDFRLALGTVRHAIELFPEDPVLRTFEGDMHESLFQFQEAQASYERALTVNPNFSPAHRNLVFCRRINRRRNGVLRPGTLYGLHRVMMEQGRIVEALAITAHLKDDLDLQRVTWQAKLDETGLAGKITVDAQGAMTLDLSATRMPDLSLIASFPLVGLNLADTGIADLRALRGMPLRTLDLSRTPVYDLGPLRGMPLEVLRLPWTGVVDLGPLAGSPLRELDLTGTRIVWLDPLANTPLATLRADRTKVADLRPLAALPLRTLSLRHTRVTDLRPLAHLGLQTLALDGTAVADLRPLGGCALRDLSLASTPVNDLRPLAGMPLEILTLGGCVETMDLSPLASCNGLEHLTLPMRPRSLERLARLPRLHFIRRNDESLEDMALVSR